MSVKSHEFGCIQREEAEESSQREPTLRTAGDEQECCEPSSEPNASRLRQPMIARGLKKRQRRDRQGDGAAGQHAGQRQQNTGSSRLECSQSWSSDYGRVTSRDTVKRS
jgi:hypothetical protein